MIAARFRQIRLIFAQIARSHGDIAIMTNWTQIIYSISATSRRSNNMTTIKARLIYCDEMTAWTLNGANCGADVFPPYRIAKRFWERTARCAVALLLFRGAFYFRHMRRRRHSRDTKITETPRQRLIGYALRTTRAYWHRRNR